MHYLSINTPLCPSHPSSWPLSHSPIFYLFPLVTGKINVWLSFEGWVLWSTIWQVYDHILKNADLNRVTSRGSETGKGSLTLAVVQAVNAVVVGCAPGLVGSRVCVTVGRVSTGVPGVGVAWPLNLNCRRQTQKRQLIELIDSLSEYGRSEGRSGTNQKVQRQTFATTIFFCSCKGWKNLSESVIKKFWDSL